MQLPQETGGDVPSRKSDVKDCQWLQRLHSCGLLYGVFRPMERFNAVRSVMREKANYNAMCTQAMQKSMDQTNISLHHAVRDITGVAGMKILAAIVPELGPDLSMFPNESHFISFHGLKPSLGKSACKNARTSRKAKNTCRAGQYFRQTARTSAEQIDQ